MRKFLIAISLIALCLLWTITIGAITGPEALPSRIPTHFDATGTPNAWGSPNGLFLLPAIATAIFFIIGLINRKPESFNYPVRVTPRNRERLQQIALSMIAALTAETLSLFAALQYFTIQSIRLQRNGLPPALMLTSIFVIFLTMGAHIIAMRRA